MNAIYITSPLSLYSFISTSYPSEAKRLIGRPQEALLCAKAKRQQQMFSVAKAKRQQQMFSVAKAKRQLQSGSVGTDINTTLW
ncbi:hypothetical protein [Lysinibacillus xylanilyticus]|uniref:hypothetical protein n=1 Tax=Lysinibacillus xylanilyticus TaxID=582475 RepID=UPI0010644174|nr:hypothetical protein [Lysinibacillus xylanilyticus]